MPRKYEINPAHESGDDTICMTIRRLWREGDAVGGAHGDRIKELAADAFDKAKRMNARLKAYKEGRA